MAEKNILEKIDSKVNESMRGIIPVWNQKKGILEFVKRVKK
jgi:hypothetical protein